MRILFIGCVQSSYCFLEKLIENKKNIVGVITKKASNFNSDFCDLGMVCKEHGIDYKYVININDSESKEYIREKNVDLILCLGWSHLLDAEVLGLASNGCVGFHPAELPQNRGRHPLIWALALGLEKTASTLFLMDEKADTGKIVSQEMIEIDYTDDAATLYKKVMDVAVVQLINLVNSFEQHNVTFLSQDDKQGNSWRKRGKKDGEIDWRMSSRGIYNLVRALTKPYVGAHFCHDDKEYKVWKVREIYDDQYRNIEPGKVLRRITKNQFIVKAGDNLIEVMMCDDITLSEGEYL